LVQLKQSGLKAVPEAMPRYARDTVAPSKTSGA